MVVQSLPELELLFAELLFYTTSAEEIARRMNRLSLAQVYAALAQEDSEYWKLEALHNKKT